MTPSQDNQPDRTREPLTPERTFATAVALADRDGIEAVSMRRLARELGVEAMSLYHHVANKDAIFDGMVDLVYAEIPLPGEELDWKSAMRERAIAVRNALLEHRWAIRLIDSRKNPGPADLRHHDWVIGRLRRAGFSIRMTAHAYTLLDACIYGYVVQELNLPFSDQDDLEPILDEMMSPFPKDAYPHLAEMTMDAILHHEYSFADEFAFGLEAVLTAIEAAAFGKA